MFEEEVLPESVQTCPGQDGPRAAPHVGAVSWHFLLRRTSLAIENVLPCQGVVPQWEPQPTLSPF